jgi:hypothetical protein
MELTRYLQARNWPVAAGYGLFIGMMAVGYFYNVTFIQLGLVDLGMRVLDMSRQAVAAQMAILALITCVVALGFGWWMQRHGWSTNLLRKLQLALAVVVVQTVLTAVPPTTSTPLPPARPAIFASPRVGKRPYTPRPYPPPAIPHLPGRSIRPCKPPIKPKPASNQESSGEFASILISFALSTGSG